MHHADVFEAQCWVPAEIRHLGEGRVLVFNGESVIQVNLGPKSRMRCALHLADLPCSKQSRVTISTSHIVSHFTLTITL